MHALKAQCTNFSSSVGLIVIKKAPIDKEPERSLTSDGSRVRLRCEGCGKRTLWYCSACSTYGDVHGLRKYCNRTDNDSMCYFKLIFIIYKYLRNVSISDIILGFQHMLGLTLALIHHLPAYLFYRCLSSK